MDATFVEVTAESEQTGLRNYAWRAIDGNLDTRWCANDSGKPRWFQLEFEKAAALEGVEIVWEKRDQWYQYRIETSGDGKVWNTTVDATKRERRGDTNDRFGAKDVRFLRVTVTGQEKGLWSSFREIRVNGPGIGTLFPRIDKKQQAQMKTDEKGKEYAKGGNVPPKIVKLSPEEEAAILKDVSVPEVFEVTLFSPWQSANYPVYVAASPNGDLYVSSDGNGSVGRDPHRGRVLRLRDTDRDGRADEVTEFIKDIDAPRGLIWDHDRLYLLHPPDISVHFDRDGDGVAEESKTLITGIAFGFDKRPPDHTTNGLELGIDGWIYVAGGDFGFMDAVGTDGRRLQHRGGGVIRFRPDGTGLHLFATGTRNILGTPTSPLLDIFARDNTNDGGGWNVRFHHFTGLEDHGYPRLYINFGDEIVQPLADYGGGSGCGSVYIHEPGFPEEWRNAPFTCDWGSGGLWKHTVRRKGATFEETKKPEKFIRMTRPTDADVDGMSAVYQASWKGPATFRWAGPEVGYIVRVTPRGYTPEPLPEFDKLDDAALVRLLESPSHVRTMAAQRTLLRRKPNAETANALHALARNASKPLDARVAAIYAIALGGGADVFGTLAPLADDAQLGAFAVRALGDLKEVPRPDFARMISKGIGSDDPRTRLEAILAGAWQDLDEAAPAIADVLGDSDPVIAHTAFHALAKLGASDACFALFDSSSASDERQRGAAFALMRMHVPEVVDGLVARLEKETRPGVRRHLLAALCRLHSREAEWKGESWGTRPDTRGPYYQPATWGESEKVLAALRDILDAADEEEAAFLVREMSRNRIQSNAALERIVAMAEENASLVGEAVKQIAAAKSVSSKGMALVLKSARDAASTPDTLAGAVEVLAKSDHQQALSAMIAALAALEDAKDARRQFDRARNAFVRAPKLENHHLALEKMASASGGTPEGVWANAGLLALAQRKKGSPESREMSQKAIDAGWSRPRQRLALVEAAAKIRSRHIDDRIRAALNDSDKAVADAAARVAKTLRIKIEAVADNTPKIGTLSPQKALESIVATKGDVSIGEAVYTRATCAACHTVRQSEPQKGPYLGNIAQTYKRPDLAAAIVDPNKSIAQGFATNLFTLKNGSTQMGFVTDEAGDRVTFRDIAAVEHTIEKSEIARRDTLPTSLMPPGLMNRFTVREAASLLDYLEALSKKK